MKAAIFNPYLDTLGGGERYTAGVIQAFEKNGYRVELQWKDKEILGKLTERFGVSFNNTKVVNSVGRGDGYDACFWISDGSIPLLRSRNNILHFQVPFKGVSGKTLMNRMKFIRIKHVVCNSNFTKGVIDMEFAVNSKVIYPPVSVSEFKSRRKENVISYVGRFSNLFQKKHHDILIEVFKEFYKSYNDWKLILAGGTEVGSDGYIDELRELASGLPIEIVGSPTLAKIKEILGISKMFWSASGYGVDESTAPDVVEHFGITVVEAMAAKAVPLIVNKGGHIEIVKDNETGYLWNTKEELLRKSSELASNLTRLRQTAKNGAIASASFSDKEFISKFSNLI